MTGRWLGCAFVAFVFACILPSQDDPIARDRRARELWLEGWNLTTRSEFDAAKVALDKALAIGSPRNTPMVYVRLASIERFRGRWWRGLALLRKAEESLAEVPSGDAMIPYTLPSLHLERGCCYLFLGIIDRGFESLRRCRELPGEKHATYVGMELNLELDLLLASGENEQAVRFATRALEREQAIRDSPLYRPGFHIKRLQARRSLTDDPDELGALAVDLERWASDLKDSSPMVATGAALLANEAFLAAGQPQRALQVVRSIPAGQDFNEARAARIAAAHASSLLAVAAPREQLVVARERLAAAWQAVLASWRGSPLRAGGYGTFHFTNLYRPLHTLIALDEALLPDDELYQRAFAHLDAAMALGTVSRRLDLPPTDLATFRRRICKPGTGALLTSFGRDRVQMLLVDGDGAMFHSVSRDRASMRAAHALRAAGDRPPPAGRVGEATRRVRELGERVARELLPADVRARMSKWRRVVLIGDGDHRGTMQLLPWNDSWLCVDKQLLHAPSPRLALELDRRASAASTDRSLDLVAIGDPTVERGTAEHWGVASLQLTDRERASLGAAFAARRVAARWGDDARPAALALAERAAALCVLTHGVHDYARERSAGLLFAPGEDGRSVLFAADVEKLAAPPLVVLAACAAAAGPERAGDDEAGHLTGAFLRAGANAVVTAPGSLSLGSTLALLSTAFGEWRDDIGFAEALRRARARIHADPRRAHPYFFAGLRLTGADVRPPTR